MASEVKQSGAWSVRSCVFADDAAVPPGCCCCWCSSFSVDDADDDADDVSSKFVDSFTSLAMAGRCDVVDTGNCRDADAAST